MSNVREGDGDAFGEIHRRYADRLDLFLKRLVRDGEERRDIIQETFIRVYESAPRYTERARFTTWIHTIALNLARSSYRRTMRRRSVSLDADGDVQGRWLSASDLEAIEPMPDESLEFHLDLDCTLEKLRCMRPEFSTAILLRDFLDCSYQDIARHTGESMGTVKSRINRARGMLREELARVQRVSCPTVRGSEREEPADGRIQS